MKLKSITTGMLLAAIPLLATPELTVDQLIETALKQSPDINISTSQLDAAFSRKDQADADYLPQIDALGSAGGQGVKLKDESGFTDDTLLSGSITATQLIYDFGKTGGNMDAAQYDVNASNARLQQVISDKIFDVKGAYYNVLQKKALIAVNKENVQLNESQLYRSQRYYEAGIRTKVDVTDAEVNLIHAKLSLNNSLYDYKLARVDLEKRIGTVPNRGQYTLYSKSIDFGNAYNSLPRLNESMSELEEFAYLNRYELKEYQFRIDNRYARIKSKNADYFPVIYGEGSYLMQNVDEIIALPEEQWQATVNLKWNIFSGFRTDAEVQEARIDLLTASSEYESARLEAKKRTDDAYLYVLKDLDSVKLNESLTRASKEKYHQVEQSYQHGIADYIELQKARQEYIDSLAGIVTAYYSYYIALARLDNAVGR
ncbi:MAG: TolC family protein [Campylobacterota bacterium]|nr:TolC family protein [Campylobacterota bacterium]